jgi:hypothetical protein
VLKKRKGSDVMLVKVACQESCASLDNRGMIATRTLQSACCGRQSRAAAAVGEDFELGVTPVASAIMILGVSGNFGQRQSLRYLSIRKRVTKK